MTAPTRWADACRALERVGVPHDLILRVVLALARADERRRER